MPINQKPRPVNRDYYSPENDAFRETLARHNIPEITGDTGEIAVELHR
jgi:hypothetical protein